MKGKMRLVLRRLAFVTLLIPFIVYLVLPPCWLLGIPYWIMSGKNLMRDWKSLMGNLIEYEHISSNQIENVP